jgi:lipopolysaccharide transport system ATP-binding protein
LNLLGIVHRHRFAAKAGGREPGYVDESSHYRKGVAGDWTNHFTPAVEREFKRRHGHLLIKLGYTESFDWSFER